MNDLHDIVASRPARERVGAAFNLAPARVLDVARSRDRRQPRPQLRQALALHLRYHDGWSLERIGRLLDRHHATIIHYLYYMP